MKKYLLSIVFCIFLFQVHAQYFRLNYFINACAGNPLNGASKIYLYAGAGTTNSTSTYDYTAGTFSGDSLRLTYVGNNTWQICFNPYDIFHNTNGVPMPGATTIFNFEINFRDSAGLIFTGQCGSNSFIQIDNPMTNPQTIFPNIINGLPVSTCVVGVEEYNTTASIVVSPNPMHSSGGQFEIKMQEEHEVSLQLFNMLGKKVRTIVDHKKLSGNNKFYFNGYDDKGTLLPSGCYFYAFTDNNKTIKSGRLILLN